MSAPTVLSVNAGSSSLKCALFDVSDSGLLELSATNVPIATANAEGLADAFATAVRQFESGDLQRLTAIGHRVVHGGDRFRTPVEIDAEVLASLRELEPLAPLHLPANRMLIQHCQHEFPDTRQVACFDTAFHQTIPAINRNYALPRAMTRAGLRGYGFHGLSYAYVWSVLESEIERARDKRIIVAHLGAGSSLCAIESGRSVATTMGFSTADGVPMATRSGALDPGLLIHLMREHGMTADDLEQLIYREGGLLAVSGSRGRYARTQSVAKSARQRGD